MPLSPNVEQIFTLMNALTAMEMDEVARRFTKPGIEVTAGDVTDTVVQTITALREERGAVGEAGEERGDGAAVTRFDPHARGMSAVDAALS